MIVAIGQAEMGCREESVPLRLKACSTNTHSSMTFEVMKFIYMFLGLFLAAWDQIGSRQVSLLFL